MKNGTCVKCQSDEVFVVHNNARLFIGFTHTKAPLDTFICADCGYTETYINRAADLEHIRANYPYADGRKQKRKNDE